MTKKGKDTPMDKLTAGYEKLMKGKKENPKGLEKFKKAIKKAAKQRDSK